MRESQKIRYEQRKAEHRCVQCGEQDERTLSGLAYCGECSRKQTQAKKYRMAMRLKNRRCTQCGRQDERTLSGKHQCARCAECSGRHFYNWVRRQAERDRDNV